MDKKNQITIIILLALLVIGIAPLPYRANAQLDSHSLIVISSNEGGEDIYVKALTVDPSNNIVYIAYTEPNNNPNDFFLAAYKFNGTSIGEIREYKYITTRSGSFPVGYPVDMKIYGNRLYVLTDHSIVLTIYADPSSGAFLYPMAQYTYRLMASEEPITPTALEVSSNGFIYVAYTQGTSNRQAGVISISSGGDTKACRVSLGSISGSNPVIRDLSLYTSGGDDYIEAAGLYDNNSPEGGRNPFYVMFDMKCNTIWSMALSDIDASIGGDINDDRGVSIENIPGKKVAVITASGSYGDSGSKSVGYIGMYDHSQNVLTGHVYLYMSPLGGYMGSLWLAGASYAGNGKIYAVGVMNNDISANKHYNITMLEIDPEDYSVTGAWILNGGKEEALYSAHMFNVSSYVWAGATSSSYVDGGNTYAALLVMMSPSMKDKDKFMWDAEPPSYAVPSSPYVKTTKYVYRGDSLTPTQDVVSMSADYPITGLEKATSVDHNEYTSSAVHKAHDEVIPVPVPEPWMLPVIMALAVAFALAASGRLGFARQ